MKCLKILFILLLVFLCGCAKDAPAAETIVTTVPETTESTEGTLLEIIDERPQKVLTQTYKLQELRDAITSMEMTLADLHANVPIECMKEDYVIYSVEEGGYYYAFWNAPGTQKPGDMLDLSTAKITECQYVPRVCTESDFDTIVMGASTAADVQAIDPTVVVDYGRDNFGGASARGHEAYCFVTLENGEYFFIGFDGTFGDESALIATEMEIVNKEEACMVWSLNVDREDWPVSEEKQEEIDWDALGQAFADEIANPIDGTGMVPLIFVDTKKEPQTGYLICAGGDGEVYIADRFKYNGKSLYWEEIPEAHVIDYQKGPYSTEIMDLSKGFVFRDFKGNSVNAKVLELTGDFEAIIEFLKIRTHLNKSLSTDSRFWLGTYEGVDMFPADGVYTENGFTMDLDGDGTEDRVEVVLTEDEYREDEFTGYKGYAYTYVFNICRNGRTFRIKPYADWVRVVPEDIAVFAADVDLDGEYEIVKFYLENQRFGGISVYDFTGTVYEEQVYTISPMP